jgi:hypothetical protein
MSGCMLVPKLDVPVDRALLNSLLNERCLIASLAAMSSTNHVAHAQEATASSALSDSATISTSPQGSTFASASKPYPAVIPPEHPVRTLILCFDGTGDQSVARSPTWHGLT